MQGSPLLPTPHFEGSLQWRGWGQKGQRLPAADQGPDFPGPLPKAQANPRAWESQLSPEGTAVPGLGPQGTSCEYKEAAENTEGWEEREHTEQAGEGPSCKAALSPSSPCPPVGTEKVPIPPKYARRTSSSSGASRTEASQLQSSSCQLLPPGTRAHQATEDTPSSQGVWAWLRPSRKTVVPSQVAIPFVGRVPLPSYTPQAGGAVAEVAHLFGGARVGVRARCSPAHAVSGRVSVCPCALSGTACPPVLAQARHACGVQPRESVGDSQRSRHM